MTEKVTIITDEEIERLGTMLLTLFQYVVIMKRLGQDLSPLNNSLKQIKQSIDLILNGN